MKKETSLPQGPFGPLTALKRGKVSEAALVRLHCYGWLDKVNGEWELNHRGRQLYYWA